MKIACFTVAAMDYFPQQKKFFAGGNSLNQAVRFRKLGYQSSFVGALGTDEAGDRIEELLRKASVDVSHLYRIEGITACNQLVNDERGERMGLEGAWHSGVYEVFTLGDADWNYIEHFDIWATHANGPSYAQSLARKTKENFLVVDFLHFDTYELLEQGLHAVDIAYFGGVIGQLDDLVAISKRFTGVIVLTLGSEGSIAIQNGKTIRQPALQIDKVVDTTGCGDAFQAGFSAEYFKTRDIQKALLAGSVTGREAATGFGGVPW